MEMPEILWVLLTNFVFTHVILLHNPAILTFFFTPSLPPSMGNVLFSTAPHSQPLSLKTWYVRRSAQIGHFYFENNSSLLLRLTLLEGQNTPIHWLQHRGPLWSNARSPWVFLSKDCLAFQVDRTISLCVSLNPYKWTLKLNQTCFF